MTADYRPYEILRYQSDSQAHPDDRFWTFAEVVQESRRRTAVQTDRWTFRQRKVRDKTFALNAMLAERGLTGWRAWYIGRRFLNGWMVNDSDDEEGMQLAGGSYAQAVEMIRSGSLDFLAGKITAKELFAKKQEQP